MREILFKAKVIDTGEWIEGIPIKTHIGLFMCFDENPHYCNQYGYMEIDKIIKVDESTLCQYTGLTDKNGNKIWENDIVKCNYNDYGEKGTYIGKAIFREDNCTFIVTDGKSTDYEWWNEEKEVIGNIFDNACIDELLKGEEG